MTPPNQSNALPNGGPFAPRQFPPSITAHLPRLDALQGVKVSLAVVIRFTTDFMTVFLAASPPLKWLLPNLPMFTFAALYAQKEAWRIPAGR